MDPQLETRLATLEAKVDENYRLLTRIRRSQRNSNYARYLYWGVLILAGFGAFYFIQPFLSQLGAAYGLTTGEPGSAQSFTTSGLIDQLKQFQDMAKNGQ